MSLQQDFSNGLFYRLDEYSLFSPARVAMLVALGNAMAGHESFGFKSSLCVNYNNAIGYTCPGGKLTSWQSGYATDQPEEPGFNPYGAYEDIQDCGCELADYIVRHKSVLAECNDVFSFAAGLKSLGYFTDSVENYGNDMQQYFSSPGSGYSQVEPSVVEKITGNVRVHWVMYAVLTVVLGVTFYVAFSARRIFNIRR